jgi:hypothetical protein
MHTYGSVTIERKNGIYTINGGQKNKGGDWISIIGKIEILDPDNFIFYGTIKVYNPNYAEDGESAYCEWTGDAPFKYYRGYGEDCWRRLPGKYEHFADQPCVSLTRAIDILSN